MNPDKFVAIVAPGDSERRTLDHLLVSEGFRVDTFSDTGEFSCTFDPARIGCLIIDLDPSRDVALEISLIAFAKRWSQVLPVIVIGSDPARLPKDPLLPSHTKSAGEPRLLYLVYGALGEPTPPLSNPVPRCRFSPQ